MKRKVENQNRLDKWGVVLVANTCNYRRLAFGVHISLIRYKSLYLCSIITGLGEAAVDLFNKDSRLTSARGNEINRMALLHNYINALCPDCVAFISQLPKDSEDFSLFRKLAFCLT